MLPLSWVCLICHSYLYKGKKRNKYYFVPSSFIKVLFFFNIKFICFLQLNYKFKWNCFFLFVGTYFFRKNELLLSNALIWNANKSAMVRENKIEIFKILKFHEIVYHNVHIKRDFKKESKWSKVLFYSFKLTAEITL